MEIRIRPILEKDAMDMQEIRLQRSVMQNLLSIPSEPVEKILDFIDHVDGMNNHVLVAETVLENGNAKVIGSAGLHISTVPRTRHCSTMGIMVNENFHNMGVGSKLMESLLDLSDNWLKIVRMELFVFTENKGAVKFYERHGFEIEGLRRKASIRLGEYADEYVMARVKE